MSQASSPARSPETPAPRRPGKTPRHSRTTRLLRIARKRAYRVGRNFLEPRFKKHPALIVVVVWLVFCFVFQEPSTFVRLAALLLGAAYVFHHTAHRMRHYNWAIAGLVAVAGILSIGGTYNLWRDLVCISMATAVTAAIWYQEMRHRKPLLQTRLFFTLVVGSWLLWSAGDAVFERKSEPRDPSRFRILKERARYPQARVGLALSGGGYRAALLHAGVLAGLETARVPVTNISAVSGGSIIGGYYVLGGTPEQFMQAVSGGRLNLYREILDLQNFTRLPFPARIPGTRVKLLPFYSFDRTDVQANLLDRRLFRSARLGDVPSDAPRLMICTSDLPTGRAVGLTRDWMLGRFMLTPAGEEAFPNAQNLYHQSGLERTIGGSSFSRVSSADYYLAPLVAASGAVPLAFNAVPFGKLSLADGGVTDNTGMMLLLDAERHAALGGPNSDSAWSIDLAISVDAGQLFDDQQDEGQGEFQRALDIMFHRAGLRVPEEPRDPSARKAPTRLLLSPSLYVDNSVGSRSLDRQQRKLSVLIAEQLANIDGSSLEVLESAATNLPPDLAERVRASIHALRTIPKPAPGDASPRAAEDQKQRLVALNTLITGLAPDFASCVETFLSTGTLANSIRGDRARQLFRLGEYLVVLNSREINETLANLAAPGDRAAQALTLAEQHEILRRWRLQSSSRAAR